MNPFDIHSLTDLKTFSEGTAEFEQSLETLAVHTFDDIFIKVFSTHKAGTFVGKHVHHYNHGHMVCSGAIRVFVDGIESGDFYPGQIVQIMAGKEHVLLALLDNTIGACIHNTHGEENP